MSLSYNDKLVNNSFVKIRNFNLNLIYKRVEYNKLKFRLESFFEWNDF